MFRAISFASTRRRRIRETEDLPPKRQRRDGKSHSSMVIAWLVRLTGLRTAPLPEAPRRRAIDNFYDHIAAQPPMPRKLW